MGLRPRPAKKRKSVLDGLQSAKEGWKETFRHGQGDLYPCPACNVGRLSPVEGTFQKGETLTSRRTSYEDDPYISVYEQYRFSGLLACSKKSCEEVASISGLLEIVKETREVDDEYGQLHETMVETSTYYPDAIVPSPRLFVAPANCPANIAQELDRAFKLFWVDDRACANSIRSAVELFMDHQKVSSKMQLHHRIEAWEKRPHRGALAKALMAIKFIGNEGSHGSKKASVTREDIYDGVTFFKHVLDEVFTNESHAKAIEAIAKKIVKHKRPRSQLKAS
jgi:hypothetical protein